ncbi:uncharacterized protein [Primulina eburnea]|uniref:uncharacterized protein n=1 Tax=Primulina eburnea TaxID=1245227 RepID=UPI003C6C966D
MVKKSIIPRRSMHAKEMISNFWNSVIDNYFSHPRWELLLYVAMWTAILTATVAAASLSPEFAFISAAEPSSSSSRAYCAVEGSYRLPLDSPTDNICIPGQLIKRSLLDFIIPPVFAAIMVVGSACLLAGVGLWEDDEDLEY